MSENTSTMCERIVAYFKKTKVLLCKFFQAYFNSWWLLSVTMLCVLLTIKAAAVLERFIPFFSVPDFAVIVLFLLLAFSAIAIFLTSAWNFTRKRYYKGMINFLAALAALIVAVPVISMAITFYRLLGPSEDGFADDLHIPQNVATSEPQQPLPNSGRPERKLTEGLFIIEGWQR